MNDKVAGIIRHVLTTAGGILVTKGMVDEATVQAVAGGAAALVGFLWSVWAKKARIDGIQNKQK